MSTDYQSFGDTKQQQDIPELVASSKKQPKPTASNDENDADENSALLSPEYQNNSHPFYKKRVYPKELLEEKTSSKNDEKTSSKKEKKKKNKKLKDLHADTRDEDSDHEDNFEAIFNRNDMKRKHNDPYDFNSSCVLLYVGIFLFAAALCYGLLAFTQAFACLGPPYLYITHKGSKNIMKFSRDGCLIHEKVLWGVSNEESDLRGMAYGKYNHKDVLYVADASSTSGLIMFGECFDSTSLRPFISRVVTSLMNPGASRTYGIAVDRNGDVYASFQKTDSILRFSASNNFQPIPNYKKLSPIFYFKNGTKHEKENPTEPLPSSPAGGSSDGPSSKNSDGTTTTPDDGSDKKKKDKKKKSKKSHDNDNNSTETSRRLLQHDRVPHHNLRRQLKTIEQPKFDELSNLTGHFTQANMKNIYPEDFFNGTFVQFGYPSKHDSSERGIRAIQWVKNYTEMWIANEDMDSVVVVDREGRYLGAITMKSPVGLYHSEADHPNLIFVSSKSKNSGGVFAFDVRTGKQVKSYQSIGMNHPTGMVTYEDVLFVNDQSRNAVLTFNITTARVIKLIIPPSRFHGDIEHIVLSHC